LFCSTKGFGTDCPYLLAGNMQQAFSETCEASQRAVLRFHAQVTIGIDAARELDHFLLTVDDFNAIVLYPRHQHMKTVGAEVNGREIG
jgi:hypothetical protein